MEDNKVNEIIGIIEKEYPGDKNCTCIFKSLELLVAQFFPRNALISVSMK